LGVLGTRRRRVDGIDGATRREARCPGDGVNVALSTLLPRSRAPLDARDATPSRTPSTP